VYNSKRGYCCPPRAVRCPYELTHEGGLDAVVQDTFTASEMRSLAATHGVTEAAVAHFFGTLRSRMRKYLSAVSGTASISSPGKFQQVRNSAAVATETAPAATAATAAVTAEVLAPLLQPGVAGGLRVGTSAAVLQLMRQAKRIGERTLLLHAVCEARCLVTRVWLESSSALVPRAHQPSCTHAPWSACCM
jgi:hypothetical protein